MISKDKMLITGGHPLVGEITVSGGKNTAVAVIPATLLCDEAGTKAILRAIPILTKGGFNLRALALNDAKDPDEYIQRFGAEPLARLLENAPSHITFQLEHAKSGLNMEDTEDKVKFLHNAAKIISTLESPVQRDAYVRDTAIAVNASQEALAEEVRAKVGDAPASAPIPMRIIPRGSGVEIAKQLLISLMAANESVRRAVRPYVAPDTMLDYVYGMLIAIMYESMDKQCHIAPATLLNNFETENEQQKASAALCQDISTITADNTEKTVNDLVRRIRRDYCAEKRKGISSLPGNEFDAVSKELDEYRTETEQLKISIQ